jgi:hypothetical protein
MESGHIYLLNLNATTQCLKMRKYKTINASGELSVYFKALVI